MMAPFDQLLAGYRDQGSREAYLQSYAGRRADLYRTRPGPSNPLISKSEYHRSLMGAGGWTVMEIGILRFPQSEHEPIFTVSR